MSTTTLFVEILIIGMEALVWLGITLSLLWGPDAILDLLEKNRPHIAMVTPLLLALAYVVGIVVDRLADSLFRPLRYNYKKTLPASVREMRLRVMHFSDGMAKFLEYQRSRLRIARATVFNLLMILLVSAFWMTGIGGARTVVLPSFIAGGAVALTLSMYAAWRIDRAQMANLVQAFAILTEDKEPMRTAQRLAAAVCYRRADSGIEFLLVRTKGGKYWTFPKGHIKVKQKEAPWYAAKREAGEEAGVDGSIDREPFTRYAYFKGKGAREEIITAFLMHVTSEREPDEPGRNPQWFTPEAAVQKLSEGRHKKFIIEHRRVIDEALSRLG